MTALDVLALVAALAIVGVLVYVADSIKGVNDENDYNSEQGVRDDDAR